jgi:hypothetical protein
MRKLAGFLVALLAVVSMLLGVATLTPDAHAVNPKVIKCWTDCFAPELVECCRYAAPGYGSWVECTATGRYCAPI